jgi:hypothetical protein
MEERPKYEPDYIMEGIGMKKIIFIISLLFIAWSISAQEYTIEEMTNVDMLEFHTEQQAEHVADLLFQVGVEVEVQEGFVDGEERFYIELQDITILDIEIEQLNGTWKRWFPKNIKNKLIHFTISPE